MSNFIKICGITTREDARMAERCGASAVGLIVAPSKRQVTLDVAADISASLSEIPSVVVCRQMTDEEILTAVEAVGSTWVQLHDPASMVLLERLSALAVQVIEVHSSDSLPPVRQHGTSLMMIDGAVPGSGEVADWRKIKGLITEEFILAGGLTPINVSEAISRVAPWGVDVATGVETSPGVKSQELVERFVSSAKMAFSQVKETL